ncbi:unnamed protein product [Adineta steineri]|uniref:Uncharacterized protein n=1 Tax=Adineta steineri TaxID=433720 RepID=A0A819DNG1_9BILA|nr:unnamed protein product [Adineta steineri]CAF3838895.1 unnamed protein product [Adineta steineri]
MKLSSHFIERKAVDVSGRLGTLYDVSQDKLIDQYSVKSSEIQSTTQHSICRIFSGAQFNNIIDVLKEINFDDGLLQSILLSIIQPSGISSAIDYTQSINENTRFLYYAYVSKEEISEDIDEIVTSSSYSSCATHIIMKTIWGFEILCILSIPNDQSTHALDSLLRNIAYRLEHNEKDFVLTDREEDEISSLTDITIFGSETCIDNHHTTLLTVFNRIKSWQTNENFHQPLQYTMCCLESLYNNDHQPELCDSSNLIHDQTLNIESMIMDIDIWIKHLVEIFKKIPKNFSSRILNKRSNDFQEQFCNLLTIYGEFRSDLRKLLIGIRRNYYESIEIDNVISDEYYSLLQINKIKKFFHKVNRWLTKALLFEQLNKNQIRYIDISTIRVGGRKLTKIEDIEAIIKRILIKENYCDVTVWYSDHRLQSEEPDIWKFLYQKLISERQQTNHRMIIVYADFTDCHYKLKDNTLLRLSMRLPDNV